MWITDFKFKDKPDAYHPDPHLTNLYTMQSMEEFIFNNYRERRETFGILNADDKEDVISYLEYWLQFYYETHPNWRPEKMVKLEKEQEKERIEAESKRQEDKLKAEVAKIRQDRHRREWVEVAIAGVFLVSVIAIHLYFTMR